MTTMTVVLDHSTKEEADRVIRAINAAEAAGVAGGMGEALSILDEIRKRTPGQPLTEEAALKVLQELVIRLSLLHFAACKKATDLTAEFKVEG